MAKLLARTRNLIGHSSFSPPTSVANGCLAGGGERRIHQHLHPLGSTRIPRSAGSSWCAFVSPVAARLPRTPFYARRKYTGNRSGQPDEEIGRAHVCTPVTN